MSVHLPAWPMLLAFLLVSLVLALTPGQGVTRRVPARVQRAASAWRHALWAIPVFTAIYLAVAIAWQVPSWVAMHYLAVSLICFVAYALDKSAATAGRRRVAERTLLLLGMAGGWPGAVLAQQWLRHKTRKSSFQAAFWGSVAINVTCFVALLSPAAARIWAGG